MLTRQRLVACLFNFARALAAAADRGPALVIERGALLAPSAPDPRASGLPPAATMLERFVRDGRWMRSLHHDLGSAVAPELEPQAAE